MERLNRAVVVPKDNTDLNQLTSLLDSHAWLRHADAPQYCAVGQVTYVFFNIDSVYMQWVRPVDFYDSCISINELASQLAIWASKPRYNP